ncbi:adhesion G-protein coupled receptor G2-like [Labeo rohita]|uniref:adhesion G-protein coupled receptor G2-like n=1 Tax=Labeo rohita TaxID=84645 RepID=UPI0021E294E3|nr:adhesion G-protein coupled receptor G2-like [Labeo rohita]
MSQRAKDMTLLLLLIMMYGPNGGKLQKTQRGQATLALTNDTIETRISFGTEHNVTILDTAGQLVCNSNKKSCYIECSSHNLFENVSFTVLEKLELTIINVENTTIDFNIIVNQTSCSCTVVDCLPDEISKLLTRKERQMNIPKDMRNILNIKQMCKEVIFHEAVLDTYIRVEKKAINSIVNMTIPEQSKNYYEEDISMTVVKIYLNTTNGFVPIAAPSVLNYDKVADTFIPVEPFKNETQNKIGVVTYNADEHFKTKVRNKFFTSKVIRIEVPDRDIANLKKPLKMNFKINSTKDPSASTYTVSCQFYDEKGDKTWKTDGCETAMISDDVVECSCDHMTPFAVLLVDLKISKNQWEILSYISYTGCSLSAFFSASTVLMFIFNGNARAEVSSSIHVSLSGALFLLNMSFMFSEWAATWTVKEVCVFIAATIHYSLLCSFTWMAIEALHLYLLLIRVFNIYIKHYMVKLSLIGWGVPAVIVGCLLSVNNIYGISNSILSDTNTTNQICWIKEPRVLYGVSVSYFSIVFLFNLGILITVSRQIFKLRKMGNRHNKMPVCKDLGTVLSLMCLLGTTWGLAFFSSGYTNYPILYLFCILNTMQGFYIFVWMCAVARKNSTQTPHSKSTSTLDTSK